MRRFSYIPSTIVAFPARAAREAALWLQWQLANVRIDGSDSMQICIRIPPTDSFATDPETSRDPETSW